MPRFPLHALLLSGLVALAPAAQAQTFSDTQKQAIGEIVREYLIKNPEVLQEAITELERRQQETQKVAQKSAIRETRTTMVNPGRSTIAGNPSGDVTLVEFFDYNCGYCKRALSDVRALMKTDPKLKVVLKDFPVLGPDSVEASKVALAVRQQLSGDRLFDYHTRVLETRGRVGAERALAVAKDMGLDMDRLKKDVEGPEVRATLQENMVLGDKLGLSGTPAFIIGEEIIPGAVGLDPLKRTVASVRQCGQASC